MTKEDHPALAQCSEPFERLYFGAKSKDPDAFPNRLWAVHQEATDDWIPFDRCLIAKALSEGTPRVADSDRIL